MVASLTNDSTALLTLGWRVNNDLHPQYWLSPDAKPGSQSDHDLFKMPGEGLGTHTVIIAQSGSGKSFFVGVLIEELLLSTKARCLIFDPNADFRRVHDVQNAELWKDPHYNEKTRLGKLPHEESCDRFKSQWLPIRKTVKIGQHAQEGMRYPFEFLKVEWTKVSMDFLAEELSPLQQSELYECHVFVKLLEELIKVLRLDYRPFELIDVSERIYHEGRHEASTDSFQSAIVKWLHVPKALAHIRRSNEASRDEPHESTNIRDSARSKAHNLIDQAVTAIQYVSEDVGRFYFSQARMCREAGIMADDTAAIPVDRPRVEVIDLPSLPNKRMRFLAINAKLVDEWDYARTAWEEALRKPPTEDKRVPTFIVVDEAHNLLPAEPQGRAEIALRDQFRTIVAEGRKYGLFLIIISQRPEKLDPLILSDCQNKALMQLDSQAVLRSLRKQLGLQMFPMTFLEKFLDCGRSRVFVVGPWAPKGEVFYSVMRRTQEGGRDLRPEHWAVP